MRAGGPVARRQKGLERRQAGGGFTITSAEYREFIRRVKEIGTLEQVASFLSWDEQTYMAPGSAPDRAMQNSAMSGIIHERLTSKDMGRLIAALKRQELSPDGKAILREAERKWLRASSIPNELVKKITAVQSMSMEAWARARDESRFEILEPWLKKTIDLKLTMAEHIGYEDRPYDALLDEYEPGMKSKDVDALFSSLKSKLVPLAARILNEPDMDHAIPAGKYPLDTQRAFIVRLCGAMGYDLERGRIDVARHPFTTGSGRDVRITVRYDEANPVYAIFPAMHETGHALYEQGYQEKYFGTPLAEAVSLGIHESQSRLWENMVGRSMPFWRFYYPKLQQSFPGMKRVPLQRFYGSINNVKRSYIRVDADEVTYNLHIMLRYDVESALFGGKLKAEEIPAYWNELFERYMGIPVPDDAKGCLQDIHWAIGSFGYFPTYTLGNLYAAQLWSAANRQMPVLEDRILAGDLSGLRDWLRKNVHRHGKRYPAPELIRKATGQKLDEDYFIRYIKEKYSAVYGMKL